MAVAMLTSRIDENIKAEGNAVFAQMGYSPTQIVQLVWDFAARHAADTQTVSKVLSAMERNDRNTELDGKADAFKQAILDADAFREGHGLNCDHGLSDDELLFAALSEKYGV